MKKIFDFFRSLDKQLHILASFTITAGLFLFISHWNRDLAFVLSLIIGTGAGFAKEYYDLQHPEAHSCDVMDLWADLIGVLAAFFLAVFSII